MSFALNAGNSWSEIDLFITLIFVTDIILNFSTGYYYKGNLIMDRKSIATNYFKFWFWLDIFSTIPYDDLMGAVVEEGSLDEGSSSNTSSIMRMLKIFRILRFFRLLRIAKLRMLFIRVEENILSSAASNFLSLVKVGSCIFIVSHWFACLMYFVAFQEVDSTGNNWVTAYQQKYNLHHLDIADAYISSLYWAFTTMATIGYGDIVPVTSSERILGIFCMMITSAIFGYIVGDITSIISKQSENSKKKSESLVLINAFLKKNGFSKEFSMKIKRYIENVYDNQCDDISETHLLSILSLRLREEIYKFINGNLLKLCNVITKYHENFISQLAKSAHTKLYAPNDIVFKEGEKGNMIYFIKAGNVCVYNQSSNYELATLKENKYFGEIAFFSNRLRIASAKCRTFVEILSISKLEFMNLEETYPEAKELSFKLEATTKDGDYTVLGVTCYLCKKLGHAAIDCTQRLFKLDKERAKKYWIERRNKTKLINPYMTLNEKVRQKPTLVPRWGAINITSRVRPARKYSRELNEKIAKYIEKKDLERVYLGLHDKSPQESNKISKSMILDPKNHIIPIVEEDEESVDSEDLSRRSGMKFDNVNLTVSSRLPNNPRFSQAVESYNRSRKAGYCTKEGKTFDQEVPSSTEVKPDQFHFGISLIKLTCSDEEEEKA
jgi:hyperpolarization activated cyclic nucleotide-gated potassium channel 2